MELEDHCFATTKEWTDLGIDYRQLLRPKKRGNQTGASCWKNIASHSPAKGALSNLSDQWPIFKKYGHCSMSMQ